MMGGLKGHMRNSPEFKLNALVGYLDTPAAYTWVGNSCIGAIRNQAARIRMERLRYPVPSVAGVVQPMETRAAGGAIYLYLSIAVCQSPEVLTSLIMSAVTTCISSCSRKAGTDRTGRGRAQSR